MLIVSVCVSVSVSVSVCVCVCVCVWEQISNVNYVGLSGFT